MLRCARADAAISRAIIVPAAAVLQGGGGAQPPVAAGEAARVLSAGIDCGRRY